MKATSAGDTGLVTELWEDVILTECNKISGIKA